MKCKKLIFSDGYKQICLYGLIKYENETFISFKTAHKEHYISKETLLYLGDTDREFNENGK